MRRNSWNGRLPFMQSHSYELDSRMTLSLSLSGTVHSHSHSLTLRIRSLLLQKQLLAKDTKTSLRKLRKLGLLRDDPDTSASLRRLKEQFEEHIKAGEDEPAGDEEEDGLEGTMVDAGKAYEQLVVSLAARSGDEALRGGVVEAYGRDGERGLEREEREREREREALLTSSSSDKDDMSGEQKLRGNCSDGGTEAKQKVAQERNVGKQPAAFIVSPNMRKALQKRDFFGEHMNLPVDDLEEDTVLVARRREMQVADGESLQAWAGKTKEKGKGKGKERGTLLMTSDTSACPPGISNVMGDYKVKARLATRWKAVHEEAMGSKRSKGAIKLTGTTGSTGFGDFVSQKQAVMFGLMVSYMDVLYPLHRYPGEVGASDPIMDAALLHIINHITMSGDVIKKNNERMEKRRHGKHGDGEDNDDDNYDNGDGAVCQDQGFVRPKVLILAPFRHHAKSIVERLIQLAIQETRTDTVKNRKRFEQEFGVGEEEELVSERERMALSLKPKQHRALFDGNCDDHFRLGIKMTRGSIRLFTDFYDSDILVASPLALSTRLEEIKKDEPDPKDFLSSIEISVLYRADVLLMQNMAHVVKVYSSLNAIPKQQHNSDILRVRDWYLGARAGAYRQNILLTSFESPEINSLFSRYCLNHAGIARWKVAHRGVLNNVSPGMRHVFERLELLENTSSPKDGSKDEADIRFEHFTSQVWPKIREASGGQLLFVPSYFDLVRVRNYLRREAASFVVLSEYTTPQDMARARNYFCDGRRRVLLYTERCHFYNRHRIRGIKDIIYYQLPEHQQYYAELANFMDNSAVTGTVNVVYTQRDAMRLERVVGTNRAKRMLDKKAGGGEGGGSTFVFVGE